MPEVAAPPSPLALLRFLGNLSKIDVAHRAGLSETTVRRIENGGTPQWRTAVALAAALNVDPWVLFPAKGYNGDDPAGNRVDAQEVRDDSASNPTG